MDEYTGDLWNNQNFLSFRKACHKSIYINSKDLMISFVLCFHCNELCYLAQAEDYVDWHFFLTEQAESAIIALNCSGMLLGSQPIRFGAFP